MNPTTALAAGLALLAEALDDPDVDLASELMVLADDARRAVSSYLGLSITVTGGPVPAVIVVPPAPWDSTAGASLHLSLPTAAPTAAQMASGASDLPFQEALPRVAVTLYATTAGAFVDLGADLAFMFSLPLSDAGIDAHLPGPGGIGSPAAAVVGDAVPLTELTLINQAIGVLMGQGYEPRLARDALATHATTTGVTLAAAAALILNAAQQ